MCRRPSTQAVPVTPRPTPPRISKLRMVPCAGKFTSASDSEAFPADYPVYVLNNVESRTAADDVSIPPHYDFASIDSALISRSYSLIKGDRSVRRPWSLLIPHVTDIVTAPRCRHLSSSSDLAPSGRAKYLACMT